MRLVFIEQLQFIKYIYNFNIIYIIRLSIQIFTVIDNPVYWSGNFL